MTSGKHEGRHEAIKEEVVPDKESWGLLCNILSKSLRLQHSKDSINTAHYLVDSRLINARFVSCKDRALPPHIYPYIYQTSCTWLLLPDFPLPFCMVQAIKNWRREWPGTRLNSGNVGNTSVNTEGVVYMGLLKEYPPPTFGPISCIGSKFTRNECPPCSKLRMTNGVHTWSFRSTTSIAVHIWGKNLCIILHWKLLQGRLFRQT